MNRASFFLPVCLVLGLASLHPSASSGPSGTLSPTGATQYLPPAEARRDEVHVLDRRKGDLIRLLHLYNYVWGASPWDYRELESPLVKKHAIFRFESAEPSEGPSVFVAIFPLATGEVDIVPLWDHGLRPACDPALDRHNIAIFNRLVENESPVLQSSSARLDLAALYLHFFEERPEILRQRNIHAILGKISPDKTKSLLPVLSALPNGGFDVQLFERATHGTLIKISLTFDHSGMLRSLSKEASK